MNKNIFEKFWEGKGFYFALIIVIIGAALASYLSISAMMQRLQNTTEQQISPIPQTQQEDNAIWSEPFVDVEVKEEEIPIVPPSSSSEHVSSSQAQSSPASQSVSSTAQSEQSVHTEQSEEQLALETSQANIWVWPLEGSMLQGFSADELVFDETMGDWRTHNGYDIKAAKGTEIKAPADGKIMLVDADAHWGGIVEIAKDDTIVRICGIENITVKAGDEIKQGTKLGTSAIIPAEMALEEHVHIEVLKNGEYIDPKAFFS